MRRITIATAAAFWAALSFPAEAQMVCTMRAELVKMLGDKYKELPLGGGIVGEQAVLQVFTSEKGTFTVVSSYPNGTACIIAAGNSWEDIEQKFGSNT